MSIRFGPTEHVITADGEWVAVDALSYLHARPLLCGSCHIPVSVTRHTSDRHELIHRPCTEKDRRLLRYCRYRERPSLRRFRL